ncbi:MAG: ABC transporter ATP-binding protein [Candidatus Latescibacteria bacterium]|nr:ABC transporter ATP-binding protein [Candidatus Latescibacterota bacterium]
MAITVDPVLRVQDLYKQFGDEEVVKGISFDIPEGDTLVLLGPSGSGKSTILRLIAGIEQPDRGRIWLHGRPVDHLPARQRNIGFIFQSYALFPQMTVEQNIAFGLKIRKVPASAIRAATGRLLGLIGLAEHRHKHPSQLSGGQQQRVAIARALAYGPRLLLFDESFSALDAATRVNLRREIRSLLREFRLSAMFVTHDQEEALELGDQIAVLQDGMIEQIGNPSEVYNHPRSEFVATFLGTANLLLGRWWNGEFELGTWRLPSPQDSLKMENGQAVKLIFRPEDVVLSTHPAGPPQTLGSGAVESVSFVGAYERLVVRVNPFSTAANLDESNGHQAGLPLTVTRPKWEANRLPLSPGARVWLALKGYRLLPHFVLQDEESVERVAVGQPRVIDRYTNGAGI